MKESPAQDPRISKEELQYIEDSIGDTSHMKHMTHPWKEIFSSAAVWAIVASHFSENWGFYTLLTQLPKFLKGVRLEACGGGKAIKLTTDLLQRR